MKLRDKGLITFLLCTAALTQLTAQKEPASNKNDLHRQQAYFGIGVGLDYGGLGIKAEYLPFKYIALFGGIGYNLIEPAYNAGLSFKMLPDKKATPVILAMYGYNAAMKIRGVFGNEIVRETFYGFSAGAGAEIKNAGNSNKISLALLVPFRTARFHDIYNGYKDAGYKFNPPVLPIAFSVGINFALDKKKNGN